MQLVLDYSFRLSPYHGKLAGNSGLVTFTHVSPLTGERKLAMPFTIHTPTHPLDRIGPDGVARLLKKIVVRDMAELFLTPWGELCHASDLPDETELPKLDVKLCELILPRSHRLNGKKYAFN